MKRTFDASLPGAVRHPAALALLASSLLMSGCSDKPEPIRIGLITKTETNPYFVSMREVAEEVVKDHDAELIAVSGESDVDVATQRRALIDMVHQGIDGILITPSSSTALEPMVAAVRLFEIPIITLDTAFAQPEISDAYFATDNEEAGRLIGSYAVSKFIELGLDAPRVVTLDLAPGVSTGEARHRGFLQGFGIEEGDSALVASAYTEGNQVKAAASMAEILQKIPDVNVIYTINEPAAIGAIQALKAAGKNLDEIVLVSVDGGCDAIRDHVKSGEIDATSMQFPENMIRKGISAVATAARGGVMPSGYLNTGVELITSDPAEGVESRDVAFGIRNCWG